ncbi:MAG: DUF2232 domain-containing protein [Thermoanaerobaculia bacterium]|jgi:hypothetical protein
MNGAETGTPGPLEMSAPGRFRTAVGIAVHALLVSLTVLPPLTLFVPAIVLSAAFRYGQRAARLVLVVTVTVMLLGSLAGGSEASLAGFTAAGLLVFQIGFPALLLAQHAERRIPSGQAFLATFGMALLGVVVVEGIMRIAWGHSPYAGFVAEAGSVFDQAIAMNAQLPKEYLGMMRKVGDVIVASFLPAVITANTAIMFLVGVVMIPRLKRGDPEAVQYKLRFFALPDWVLLAFIVSGLSPFAEGQLRTAGLNVLAIVALLYWVQGLAVVRMLMSRSPVGFLASAPAFVLLGLVSFNLVGMAVLFLTGLFDSFFDFRNLKRKEDSDESDLDG